MDDWWTTGLAYVVFQTSLCNVYSGSEISGVRAAGKPWHALMRCRLTRVWILCQKNTSHCLKSTCENHALPSVVRKTLQLSPLQLLVLLQSWTRDSLFYNHVTSRQLPPVCSTTSKYHEGLLKPLNPQTAATPCDIGGSQTPHPGRSKPAEKMHGTWTHTLQ